MPLADPFHMIAAPRRVPVFIGLLALTLVVMLAMRAVDAPLTTAQTPTGIVSFEFAGSVARAQEMLSAWGASGQVYAGLSLGLDYLFMAAYALTIGLACSLIATRVFRGGAWAMAGRLLAWGQLLAGALDAIENYALIQLLLGSTSSAWPSVAWLCALLKFVLIGAGLVYSLAGAGTALARRVAGSSARAAS